MRPLQRNPPQAHRPYRDGDNGRQRRPHQPQRRHQKPVADDQCADAHRHRGQARIRPVVNRQHQRGRSHHRAHHQCQAQHRQRPGPGCEARPEQHQQDRPARDHQRKQHDGDDAGDEIGIAHLALERFPVGLGFAFEHVGHGDGINRSHGKGGEREDTRADAEDRQLLAAQRVAQQQQVDIEEEVGGQRDQHPGQREAPPAARLLGPGGRGVLDPPHRRHDKADLHQRDRHVADGNQPKHGRESLLRHGKAQRHQESRHHHQGAEHRIGEEPGQRALQPHQHRAVDIDRRRAEGEQRHRHEMGGQHALALPQKPQHQRPGQQRQRHRDQHMGIGAGEEDDELATLAPRPVFGGEIGAHGLEAQRHAHRDQIDRRDDDQIFAQQFGTPDARDQRLHQENQSCPGQPCPENDTRLRGEAPVQAHGLSPSSVFACVGRDLGLRQPSTSRRRALMPSRAAKAPAPAR